MIFDDNNKLTAITVVGGGGTGSYLIEDLINLMNSTNKPYKIKIIDGDLLEEKNLLRQGFYKDEIGLCKADALVERLKNSCNRLGTLESIPEFIHDSKFFINLWNEDKDNIDNFFIISCVDNQYARLRMTLAHHLAFHWFKQDDNHVNCYYIDSGNTEFYGQTLKSALMSTDESILGEFGDNLINNKGTINKVKRLLKSEFILNDTYLASTFMSSDNWQNNLTRADHEMSCDDMSVSSPQNILVNQFSSVGILQQFNYCLNKDITDENKIIYFNSKTLSLYPSNYVSEKTYTEFFRELLEFYLTDEGKEVFKV